MRLSETKRHLQHLHLDALIIENPVDLFYLTGQSVSLGRLWISHETCVFLVDGRYFETVKHAAPCPVLPLETTKLASFIEKKQRIGFDSCFTSVAAYEKLQQEISCPLVSVPNPLKELKMVKDLEEIRILKKAAALTWQGYQHIKSLVQEGITEETLALEFEIFCRKHGADSLSFPPIIAFQENSAYPHHHSSKKQYTPSDLILFDLGVVVDHYAADMTRVQLSETTSPKLKTIYQAVVRAQKRAIGAIRPGIPFRTLDEIARESLQQEGFEHLFTHGLSHGIGLETHEAPRLARSGGDHDLILKENMVFTVEPGVYVPGLGGVRYEDTVRVTTTGVENFFPDDPST